MYALKRTSANMIHSLIELHRHLKRELAALFPEGEARAHEALILDELLGLALHDALTAPNTPVGAETWERAERILAGLQQGQPIQQILGYAYFYNYRFAVSPHTLIPRRETEELVAWVLEDSPRQGARLLDIGTGSGCIPITIALLRPDCHCSAFDISREALAVAQTNTQSHGVQLALQAQDMAQYAPTPRGYDIMTSNPPYIPRAEMPTMDPRVRDYEPHTALFVEDDAPLLPYQHIARIGREGLCPGGRLYVETHETLTEQVAEFLIQQGYLDVQMRHDAQGKARMVRATR